MTIDRRLIDTSLLGAYNNTNTSVDSNNSQGADLDQVIALIQEISHLNTGSDQLDEQMRQLKQVAEKPTDKKDKWQALSEKVQVINQLCQIAQISLPPLTKLFHLFGFWDLKLRYIEYFNIKIPVSALSQVRGFCCYIGIYLTNITVSENQLSLLVKFIVAL